MARLVLLIESNTSGTGRLFAQAARALGYEPVLVTGQPDRYPYAAEDGVRTIIADTANLGALRMLARTLDAAEGVAGITSSSEYYVATAADLAADIGRPHTDGAAVAACRNKAFQRRRLAEAGVDDVRHAEVGDAAMAIRAALGIGLPVVLKPVAGSGSIGVRLCTTAADVERHAQNLLAEGGGSTILVEEAVDGSEYSVEIFQDAVIGVTAKHLGPLPNFVEMGHDFPAALPAARDRALSDFALAATRALGLTWGPVHVEVRDDGRNRHIMEVNPRLAGGYIPEMVRHATGIDLIQETIRLVVGDSPVVTPTRRKGAAIRFLKAGKDGLWVGAEGLETARSLAFVRDVRLYRTFPSEVIQQGDFRDRLGHVLASAPTLIGAVAAAELAKAAIHIRVAPGSERTLATVA